MLIEENLAFRIANRIISIQEVEGGYDYSIMDMDYKEIDGGIYDNPDVSIRTALADIVEDLKSNPDYNGAKGAIQMKDELIPMNYNDVLEKAEMANKIGSHVCGSRVITEFKAKTSEKFHKLGEQDPEAIEETVAAYIQSIIEAYELEATIVELAINGSRSRGYENNNSDLDIVVELNTQEKEDYLFNILNQYGLSIAGVKVDINPITKYQSGTLEQYLIVAETYMERRTNKMNKEIISEETKRKMVAEARGIVTEIDTTEHPGFKLALVTNEIAAYINPGEDVLVMDLSSKTIMDENTGVKKYNETLEKIINHGKEYDYGEDLVAFCKRSHAFEKPADKSQESQQHNNPVNDAEQATKNRFRKHGR